MINRRPKGTDTEDDLLEFQSRFLSSEERPSISKVLTGGKRQGDKDVVTLKREGSQLHNLCTHDSLVWKMLTREATAQEIQIQRQTREIGREGECVAGKRWSECCCSSFQHDARQQTLDPHQAMESKSSLGHNLTAVWSSNLGQDRHITKVLTDIQVHVPLCLHMYSVLNMHVTMPWKIFMLCCSKTCHAIPACSNCIHLRIMTMSMHSLGLLCMAMGNDNGWVNVLTRVHNRWCCLTKKV